MDICNGCNGLVMVNGEDELLLNELNELDRSTGVVSNREEEKLGMPHWQHSQDVLLLSDFDRHYGSCACMLYDIKFHNGRTLPHPVPT